MTAKLITLEGVDSAGKETQAKLLRDHLIKKGFKAEYISFPLYEKTIFGMAIDFFIRAKLAMGLGFATTDPLAASYLYAADRRQGLPILLKLMEENDYVICDRYTHSNLVHQGGKCATDEEKRKLMRQLEVIEYEFSELPKPYVTLFLYIPLEISMERAKKRAKSHGVTPDIVESNLNYVTKSYISGTFFAHELGWKVISGVKQNGDQPLIQLTEQEVHFAILETLKLQ